MMHIASRAAYPLNMAECANKGTVNFVSEVFLMNANQMIPIHQLRTIIVEPEAFYRRMLYKIKAELKSEYKNANGRFQASDNDVFTPFVREAFSKYIPKNFTEVSNFLTSVFLRPNLTASWLGFAFNPVININPDPLRDPEMCQAQSADIS